MTEQQKILVLRTYKHGESDLIVHALNSLGASMSFIAKGGLKSRKRFAGGVEECADRVYAAGVRVKRTTEVLRCLMFLSVFAFFGTLTTIAWLGYQTVPSAIASRVDGLAAEVSMTRQDVLSELGLWRYTIDTQLSSVTNKADKQLTAIQTTVSGIAGKADAQLTAVQGTVTGIANKADPLIESYSKLGDASTALVNDAKESADDLYPDLNALVQTANVTAVGIARTSEAVGKAAPEVAKAVVGIGKSADGIAGDVRKVADDVVKPKTFWGKAKMWLDLGGRAALRFL